MFNHDVWFLSSWNTEVTCHVEILKEGLFLPAVLEEGWGGRTSSVPCRGLTSGQDTNPAPLQGLKVKDAPCGVAVRCSCFSTLLLVLPSELGPPVRGVEPAQSHICWPYVKDDHQGMREPSALCTPSHTALLWALGIYSYDEYLQGFGLGGY